MAIYIWNGGPTGQWDLSSNWTDESAAPATDYPRFQDDTARFEATVSTNVTLSLSTRPLLGCGTIDFTHNGGGAITVNINFQWNLVGDNNLANNTSINGDNNYIDTVCFNSGVTSLDTLSSPTVASGLNCVNPVVVNLGNSFNNCYTVSLSNGANLNINQQINSSPHTTVATEWTVSGNNSHLLINNANNAAMTFNVSGGGKLTVGYDSALGAGGNIVKLGQGASSFTFDAGNNNIQWGGYDFHLYNGNLSTSFINYNSYPPKGKGVTWDIFGNILALEFNDLAGYSMGSDSVTIKNGGVLDLNATSITVDYQLYFESGGTLRI